MTKFFALKQIALATVLLLPMMAHSATVKLDGIAAVVDNDVVLQSELDTRIQGIKASFEQSDRKLPPDQELKTAVLNQMIVENIQLQRGENAGVKISEEQINESMARIAQSQGLSFEAFRNRIFADGNYHLVREQIRREMIINQVQMGSLSRQVSITPEELEAFLASPEGKELQENRYQVLQIIAPLASGASSANKRQANSLLSAAKNHVASGQPIANWLNQHAGKIQVKNLGWRTLEQLPSLYADALGQLSQGDMSDVLTAGNGLHLIQLIDTTNKSQWVDQYKSRHILIKTSAILDDEKAQVHIAGLRQEAIDGAEFSALAKEHSEDIGSAAEGGDLGWSEPGMFVPEFETTLATLKNGEISQPFKSQFGWHIILLEDQKRTDMKDRMLKNRAYGVLRERKFEDVREEWLEQLRDNAYVDIK